MEKSAQPVLSISNLHVELNQKGGRSTLVEHIGFDLHKGKILGLVGESGSGKTVTSMAVLQLHDRKQVSIHGSIQLNGRELNGLPEKNMRAIRGKDIAFIMQNPMNAFTPVFTIGHQFIETIRTHTALTKQEAAALAIEEMRNVNLPEPEQLLKKYPFQLSGGMLQRVMIAMAASLRPAVIIADEPTTALDVHNQWIVLRLLHKIRSEYGTAILLISHDLGVISELADDVIVMKNGTIVEAADVMTLFDDPQHDYTKALLKTRPTLYTTKQPYPFAF